MINLKLFFSHPRKTLSLILISGLLTLIKFSAPYMIYLFLNNKPILALAMGLLNILLFFSLELFRHYKEIEFLLDLKISLQKEIIANFKNMEFSLLTEKLLIKIEKCFEIIRAPQIILTEIIMAFLIFLSFFIYDLGLKALPLLIGTIYYFYIGLIDEFHSKLLPKTTTLLLNMLDSIYSIKLYNMQPFIERYFQKIILKKRTKFIPYQKRKIVRISSIVTQKFIISISSLIFISLISPNPTIAIVVFLIFISMIEKTPQIFHYWKRFMTYVTQYKKALSFTIEKKKSIKFLLPKRGEIFFTKIGIKELFPEIMNHNTSFSIVERKPIIFRGTVKENLTYNFIRVSDTILWENLEKSGLNKFINLNTKVPSQLSPELTNYLISLTRAFVMNRPVILVDLPENFPERDKKLIVDIINKEKDNFAILVSSRIPPNGLNISKFL